MEYRSLGRTGVMVSSLCLGAMNFGGPTPEAESIQIIQRALEAGINFIDTANAYNQGGSEIIIGKALKESNLRDNVVLATKVYNPTSSSPLDSGCSRLHILKACEDSLGRLQTDHIDLYQLHRPCLSIPQDETLRALDDLVRSGKVRYIGTSTFPAWFIMEGLALSEKFSLLRYVSEQPPYNLLDRRIENELIPLCLKYGVGLLPWSPLAGGILAGRYAKAGDYPEGSRATRTGSFFTDRVSPRAVDVALKVGEMALERDLTTAQLSLLWVKDQPGITSPIFGPRTRAHLEDVLVVADRKLAETDRPLFDALVHPGNAVADFFNSNDWMKARV